ncbi:hypothetical protein ACTXT7_002043 [Hymenolepis weldensis]
MPMLIEEEEAEIKEEEPTQDESKKRENILVDDEYKAQAGYGFLGGLLRLVRNGTMRTNGRRVAYREIPPKGSSSIGDVPSITSPVGKPTGVEAATKLASVICLVIGVEDDYAGKQVQKLGSNCMRFSTVDAFLSEH